MERFSGASLQQKRAFINEVVTRSDSGSWMFTIGGELFNEWQRAGSNVGLVTMGGREAAKQWGGYGMLAECKKRGEVWPVIRKGRTCYQWREFYNTAVGTKRKSEWEVKANGPPPKLFNNLRKVVIAAENMHWDAEEVYCRYLALAESGKLGKFITQQLKINLEAPPT